MLKTLFVFVCALSVCWAAPAMAYIDPGSGSAIVAAIVAFFVAIGMGLKTYWYKFKALFSGKKNKEQSDDESE